MPAKFSGQKVDTATLLTFPMPELWKTGMAAVMALRDHVRGCWIGTSSPKMLSQSYVSVSVQAKAEDTCSAIHSSFPHCTSALF